MRLQPGFWQTTLTLALFALFAPHVGTAARLLPSASPPHSGCFVDNRTGPVSYIGGNLWGDKTAVNHTTSPMACCTLCQQYAVQGCIIWQFDAAGCYGNIEGCCRLKTAAAERAPGAKGTTSGSIKPLPPLPPEPPPPPPPYTPSPAFDCGLRLLMYRFSLGLQPDRASATGKMPELFDALRLGKSTDTFLACNYSLTLEPPPQAAATAAAAAAAGGDGKEGRAEDYEPHTPIYIDTLRASGQNVPMPTKGSSTPPAIRIWVAAEGGDDRNTGISPNSPLQTLAAAQALLRKIRRNHGSKRPQYCSSSSSSEHGCSSSSSSNSDRYSMAMAEVRLNGTFHLEETLSLAAADSFTTWIADAGADGASISGGVPLAGLQWEVVPHLNGVEGKVYKAAVPRQWSQLTFEALFDSAGNRLTRARYPNGNIERDMRPAGYIQTAAGGIEWKLDANAEWHDPPRVVPSRWVQIEPCGWNGTAYGVVYPGSRWPSQNTPPTTQAWLMGLCNARMHFGRSDKFTPAVMEGPQRAICGAVWGCQRCDDARCSGAPPTAMRYNGQQLHTDAWEVDASTPPILHGFDGNRFSTFRWEVDSFANKTLQLGRGGNQAGQGVYTMEEFYVENVLAELDEKGEYYFDENASTLYLYPNTTDGSPPTTAAPLVAGELEILVEMVGNGQHDPVQNVSFESITFLNTKPSILSHRGYSTLLGGGDYAMVKAGAIVAENVDGVGIQSCSFVRLGGNAIILYSYIRNAAIADNVFFSLGANAIVSWGVAEYSDGTTGNNPEGTLVSGNYASEIGLLEKQACFYFQALSALATLERNIAFNGPRAALNFNDGFGGGAVVRFNTFANWVRETGDHGPLNGYNRQPHLTNYLYRNGTPSYTPAQNEVYSNVWLSSYHAGWTFDHDDGSSYFNDRSNLCAYGGVKSGTFSAHGKVFSSNMILFPEYTSVLDGNYPRTNGPTGGRSSLCFQLLTNPGESWLNNTCIVGGSSPVGAPCEDVVSSGNQYFTGSGEFIQSCSGKPNQQLPAVQSAGHELGSTVAKLPSEPTILKMVENFINAMPAV